MNYYLLFFLLFPWRKVKRVSSYSKVMLKLEYNVVLKDITLCKKLHRMNIRCCKFNT